MFLGVLLNSDLFFFTDSSSPVINFLDLLLLFTFESLFFFLQDALVEAHDLIVVDFTTLLHVGNLNLSDLLDASTGKFSEDFLGTNLAHQLKFFKKFVLLPFFFLLDLLNGK
jgi:hypothetical protein